MNKKISSIQKSGKKTIRILLLLAIREIYLFLRNIYGFFEHPYFTVNRILKEKDWSQEILIFGLPVYFWLIWLAVLIVSRVFIFGRLQFGLLAKVSFGLSSLFSFFLFSLLAFLLFEILRNGRRNK